MFLKAQEVQGLSAPTKVTIISQVDQPQSFDPASVSKSWPVCSFLISTKLQPLNRYQSNVEEGKEGRHINGENKDKLA